MRNQAITIDLKDQRTGAVDTYPAATDANGVAQIIVKPSAVPATYNISASSGTDADAVSGTWAATDNRDDITWVQEQLVVQVFSNSTTSANGSSQLVLPATDPASVQVTYTVNGKPVADAVVTIVLATAAVTGGSSEVVNAVTATTNASGIAVAAVKNPRGFVNMPFFVNATTASTLGNAVVLATATAPPAAAAAAAAPAAAVQPLTVMWSPTAPTNTATSTGPTAAVATSNTAAATAAPVNAPGTAAATTTKALTLPIARVDVTVGGRCRRAVRNALIASIQSAVASKLAAAAPAAATAANTSYTDKIVVTSRCVLVSGSNC